MTDRRKPVGSGGVGVDEAHADEPLRAEKSADQLTTKSFREKAEEARRNRPGRAARRMYKARATAHHDHARCKVCRRLPERELEIDPRVVAARSLVSKNHVYRVLDPNIESRRGLRTLDTMRRIAHDGLGISLDELAKLILD